jgi:hypothetical protein
MHNLPLISHHLFVAVVASEDRPRSHRKACEKPTPNSSGPARSIPLELMAQGKGMPAEAARPLRAVREARGL